MTGNDPLVRLAGSRAAASPPVGLRLVDLCRRQLPIHVSQSHQVIEEKELPDIEVEVEIVRQLAAGLARAARPMPETVDALYGLVAAVLAEVVGNAVAADGAGLQARIERELQALGTAVADVWLFVSPVDAAMMEPGWPASPTLIADAGLPRGSFRIESGLQIWEDSVARRLESCLAQLKLA